MRDARSRPAHIAAFRLRDQDGAQATLAAGRSTVTVVHDIRRLLAE